MRWLWLALVGCADTPATTWHADVRPIVQARCVSCHATGGVAPMSLETDPDVYEWKEAIVLAVADRSMPPWGMADGCRDLAVDGSLSSEEIAAFVAWEAEGYEAGEEADYVPPLIDRPPDPGPEDLLLDFGADYTPSSERLDDYRCVPIGEPLASDLYVRGLDVRPDRVELVHHVLLFAVPGGSVAELERLDAADAEIGYTCFGDTGVANSQTVGGWAPGGVPRMMADDTAMRVPAGSQLLVQVHYNTAAVDPGPDRTQVALWTLGEGERPDWLITTFPLAHTTLSVPPGAMDYTQSLTQRIPVDGTIVGTTPHMHTRGQQLAVTLTRPDGSTECISQVDDWDFNWQRGYQYAAHDTVDVSVHDQIEIACTYDNEDTSRVLQWGNGTNDEMCLNYLAVRVPNAIAGDTGTCAGFDACFEDCDPTDPWCGFACMAAPGQSCLTCGIDKLFSGCVREACDDRIAAYGLCVLDCMNGPEQFFSCTYDACGTQFAGYWQCVDPALRGECSGALDDCDG